MATPSADAAAIAHLLKRERFHRDTAQWDFCRAAFHPDPAKTHINVAWYKGDVESFLEQSARAHQGKVNIIHASFDPVEIHVRGRRATSEAFCLVTSSLTLDGVDYELASHMRLASRLEMSDAGQWYMLSLESIYVRDRLVTAFPAAGVNLSLARTEEAKAYPKGYRNLALVMLHRGLKPRLDLPHEDDQESVRRVLARNCAFLQGSKGPAVDNDLSARCRRDVVFDGDGSMLTRRVT